MGLNNPGGYKGAVKPVCICDLQNGDFETGDISPWLQYYGCGCLTINGLDAAQGDHYATSTTIGCGDVYFNFGLYQTVISYST